MKVMAEAVFHASGAPLNEEIQSFLHAHNVEHKGKAHDDRNGEPFGFYYAYVEYESDLHGKLVRHMRSRGIEVGFRYFFRFTDEEYESAPFYRMGGFGNTPLSAMESDGSAFHSQELCPGCGMREREQIGPLVLSTTRFRKRPAAWVDGHRIVVSQQAANLLEEWNVTGYERMPVIHKGRGAGAPAYQIKPTSVLPPWSPQMRYLDPPHLADRVCSQCGRRLRLVFPLHYEREALEGAQDINITSDLLPSLRYNSYAIVISARLRRLILESGLAEDARYHEPMEERHWSFEPVIVV